MLTDDVFVYLFIWRFGNAPVAFFLWPRQKFELNGKLQYIGGQMKPYDYRSRNIQNEEKRKTYWHEQ
jgi:hypothetical protein